ncbi:olfactory receptor 2G6-like [Podarcis muralis]
MVRKLWPEIIGHAEVGLRERLAAWKEKVEQREADRQLLLVSFWKKNKSISYGGYVAELYISLALGSTECVLLPVMAYDRYAAICHPLRYTTIMSRSVCFKMAAFAWLCGFSNSLVQTVLTVQLPRCGHNQIDTFFCEAPALIKLACVDTTFNDTELLSSSAVYLLLLLSVIITSYSYITAAMLRIRSAKGRQKAFSTCASHLIVVSLFYGSAICSYVQPPSSYSREHGKMMLLFYTFGTTTFNPLIYTLRNKDKFLFKKIIKVFLNIIFNSLYIISQ